MPCGSGSAFSEIINILLDVFSVNIDHVSVDDNYCFIAIHNCVFPSLIQSSLSGPLRCDEDVEL